MDRNEIIDALLILRRNIMDYRTTSAEMKKASDSLLEYKSQQPVAVSKFDEKNKQPYVMAHVGNKPVKPNNMLKIAYPVYRTKMKTYEEELDNYRARYAQFTAKYFEEYAESRAKLESEERERLDSQVRIAQQKYDTLCKKTERLKLECENDTILPDKFKKINIIQELIEYFQEQRVDSIKEAINLYYENEHRKKLESFAQEQSKRIAEAVNSAHNAVIKAEEAYDKAEDAYSKAEEAYSKAEDAYDRAEEAYDKALEAAESADEAKNNADSAYDLADEAYDKAEEACNEIQEAQYNSSSYDD